MFRLHEVSRWNLMIYSRFDVCNYSALVEAMGISDVQGGMEYFMTHLHRLSLYYLTVFN